MSSFRSVFARVRVRVTVVAALAILAAATLGSLVFLRLLDNSLEAGLVSTDRQDISGLAAQLAGGARPHQVVLTGVDDVVVQLVGGNGDVLAGRGSSTSGRPLMATPGTRTEVSVPGREDRFTVVARRTSGTGPVRLLVVGRSEEQVERATTTALGLLSVAVPTAVALLALTLWLSVGRALRPVEEMRREADAITSAHLDRRVPIPEGNDEIPRLAMTINEMLDRIQQSHRLQRQFVSDASHELRSPLAVIRQTAEVARSYPGRVALTSLADDVLAESTRLEGLVSALLLLARLDDGYAESTEELVDLDDLVLLEAERIRSQASVKVDVSQVSAGQVRGSAVLLGQVVRNLAENAVRHAESRVVMAVVEADGWVQLSVEDDGAGVPSHERRRIFGRFVRLDDARARDEGGAGLGLAIVLDIVQLSRGTIAADRSPEGGARFRVRLPAAG
jgi:signal transduction histidine kinase